MDESRRDLIKKGVVIGGVVWVAPVIHSSSAFAATGSPPPPATTTTPTTVVPACAFGDTLLDAAQEVPPNASAATGTAVTTFDETTLELCVTVEFQNLSSNAIAAHIHGPAPVGVNAPILFPFSGVPAATSGALAEQCFSLTPEQRDQLCSSLFYVNVHSVNFPGGEIRGQLEPT